MPLQMLSGLNESTSTASLSHYYHAQYHHNLFHDWASKHHSLLETNVKQESEQEPLYRAPKAAAVPLATAATVVVSASRIHSLDALPYMSFTYFANLLLVNKNTVCSSGRVFALTSTPFWFKALPLWRPSSSPPIAIICCIRT